MRESTEKLHRAVSEAIGAGKATQKQRALLARIKADYYHEFRSPLDLPVIQLVADLQSVRLGQLAARVMAGEFDASKAESDEWAASPEGQATFGELFG